MFPDPALFFTSFFLLLFGHFLGDFPLQGNYLATTKNPLTHAWQIWVTSLVAHSTIHAGIVYVLTGTWYLSLIMFITHFGIDYLKCTNDNFGKDPAKAFFTDQVLHVLVLLVITALYCG